MSVKLQVVIGIVIVLMLMLILNMVRNRKIDLRYALSWITVLAIMLVLDIFPQIVVFAAGLTGITLASNMVFLFGIIILAVLIYFLTASVSRLSSKVKVLVQEIALLKEELERLKKDEKKD